MVDNGAPVIRWPAETLWQAVAPTLPGFTVEILPAVDSTNSELMRRCKCPSLGGSTAEPILLVAEQQTAGRGRSGRNWTSERGASLTFSIGLPLAPLDWSGLSLAVGLSLANSLEPALAGGPAPRLGLKWPNDLWLSTPEGPSKLGGVLVETAPPTYTGGPRYVVIGVGLNVWPVTLSHTDGALPAVPPGSLQDLQPGMTAALTLLQIVPPLLQAVRVFEQFGFSPLKPGYARRDVLAGRHVLLSSGEIGTAQGVAANGALRVKTSGGLQIVTSAEVSVRPLARSTPLTESH